MSERGTSRMLGLALVLAALIVLAVALLTAHWLTSDQPVRTPTTTEGSTTP